MPGLTTLLDLAGNIVVYTLLGPILVVTGCDIIRNAVKDADGYFDGYNTPGFLVQWFNLQENRRKLQGYLVLRGTFFTLVGIVFLYIGATIAHGYIT